MDQQIKKNKKLWESPSLITLEGQEVKAGAVSGISEGRPTVHFRSFHRFYNS